jgi:hypothetical protein
MFSMVAIETSSCQNLTPVVVDIAVTLLPRTFDVVEAFPSRKF